MFKEYDKITMKGWKLTSRPTQKEWSCDPHCLAALVPAKWRWVTAATNDESSPPDSRTPNGTSVINLLITACSNNWKLILFSLPRLQSKKIKNKKSRKMPCEHYSHIWKTFLLHINEHILISCQCSFLFFKIRYK